MLIHWFQHTKSQPQWLTSSKVKNLWCLASVKLRPCFKVLIHYPFISFHDFLVQLTPFPNVIPLPKYLQSLGRSKWNSQIAQHTTKTSQCLPPAVLLPLHTVTMKRFEQRVAGGISIARHCFWRQFRWQYGIVLGRQWSSPWGDEHPCPLLVPSISRKSF